MRSSVFQLTAALASLAAASPASSNNQSRNNSSKIQWQECEIGRASGDCGTLKAPLDYTDKDSDRMIDLSMFRLPAVKEPKKGSILFNFGGPGASGIEDITALSDMLPAVTGGHHDLINIVPRGTNNTLPYSCYTNQASRNAAQPIIAGNASDIAQGEAWAQAALFTQNCALLQNDTGRFVGTAFTARDHMRVVDALEEDGMLRFWGMSYGTLLGQTLMAMFPDKVDKVLLDGVVNADEYYQNTETELVTSVDDVLRGFCEACVELPEACPLAGDRTADQVEEFIYDMLEEFKYEPLAVPGPGAPGGGMLIDYSTIKTTLYPQLYFPVVWANTSVLLDNVARRDIPGTIAAMNALGPNGGSGEIRQALGGNIPPADNAASEALPGIKCSDVLNHTTNLEDLRPIFDTRRELSRFAGDASDETVSRCAQWQLPAKERYRGDFSSVKTKNPVMMLNNRFDPITPLASAKNARDTFEGSALVEQNSFGHVSIARGSLCAAKAIRAYFQKGELPEDGTVCEDSGPKLFSGGDGWDEVIEKLSNS